MLLGGYLKLALTSIRSAKWRSLLTMIGIVIGIVSVVTTVSLGEGVKQQVINQINERGDDLITVLPGQRLNRDKAGNLSALNPFALSSSVLFNDVDYQVVRKTKGVASVVPFGQVVGVVKTAEREYSGAQVIATNQDLPEVINQDVQFGSFFKDEDPVINGAIIGQGVAEKLFQENIPMGKSFSIRGQEFIVRGVFDEFANSSPFLPAGNYNDAVFISYRNGQELMGGNLQIYQILVKPSNPDAADQVAKAVNDNLKKARADQQDFTVLRQEENLELAGDVLNLLTSLIAGIAAISLLVGGIGIMNIMLVSVSERTTEIGVRKAVGATNRQILYQFVVEAAVLSLFGGLLGILMSVLVNFTLRVISDLQPVITLPAVVVATGVSLVVGIIFGVAPAVKAARKDPIDSLRYE